MSARSTAGVVLACACGKPSPLPWINAAADKYRGPRLAVAVQVARAARVVDGQLECAVGVMGIARRAGTNRWDARRHLDALVADGFLEDGPPGCGRGVTTVYTLVGLALLRRDQVASENGAPGHPYQAENGAPGHPYQAENGAPGHPYQAENGAPGHPYRVASPLVGVVTTTTGGRGGGEPSGQAPPDPALAEVLAGLPALLVPRTAEQEAETAALVAGWLAAGWTADGIVRTATAALQPGHVGNPPGMLAYLVPPRPVTALRPTPTPDRYVAAPAADVADPATKAAAAALARELMRANARAGGAS